MKKGLFLWMLMILISGMISAQSIIIGTQVIQSGTMSISPYNGYWESRRVQFVYTAAEIITAGGLAGNITALSWDVSELTTTTLAAYEIKMAHTTATDASAHNAAALTTVKNAADFTPAATGWVTITFDTPFVWNGTDNILVDVCWGVNATYTSTGQVWLYNNVVNQMRGITSGSASQCGSNTSSTRSGKPRIQLFMPAATCFAPTGISASNVTMTTADLSWTAPIAGVPVNYEWKVVAQGAGSGGTAVASGIATHPTVTATATGLSAGSSYDVYVRTFCGGSDYSSWTNPYTFITVCNGVNTFPFAESFDGALCPPTCWSVSQISGIGNWDRVTAGTNPTCAPQSGAGMLQFNSFNLVATISSALITPPIDLPADGYVVNFWMYRDSGYPSNRDSVNIYYNTSASLSGASLLRTVNRAMNLTPVEATQGWYEYSCILPAGSMGTGRYVIFQSVSAFGNNIFLDDVSITAPITCPKPTLPTATNITVTTADLAWTENGSALSWQIEYGLQGFTLGTGTKVLTGTNPYPLTGLLSSSAYTFRVRSICGINDTSSWSTTFDFATVCAPVAVLPWTENFEGVVIPAFPSCWTYENGDWETVDNASSTNDANARSGTQFLTNAYSATNEFIWTPGFELTAGTSYDFSFWWAGDDYDEWTGDVFYNTSDTSLGATQLGVSFVVPATVTDTIYQEFKNSFVPATTGVYYFAIRVNASGVPWFLSFDDFKMELTPVTDIAVIQTDIDLCDTLGLFTPPITLYNTGNTVIPTGQNINISYQVDGGAVVVDNITLAADLNPLGNTMVFFTTPYLFNQFVTYSCMMAASLTGDLIQTNDTADFNLSFYHNPTVNLGHDTTLCSNQTIILDAGNPGATYSWWNGSSTQIYPLDSTFVGGVGTANFWVNVEDIHGCSSRDTISITWSICTGIDQIENISMTIMPNPTNGLFTVDFGGLTGSTYVEISDLTGKVAISETLKLTGIERASYDLSSYAKGIYNIRIVNNSQVAVRKIIVN